MGVGVAESMKQKTQLYVAYKRCTSALKTHTDWNWRDGKTYSMQREIKSKLGYLYFYFSTNCNKKQRSLYNDRGVNLKLNRTLWGPPRYKSFPCPPFLVCRKQGSIQPPWQIRAVVNQGREGMQEKRRSSQETIVQGCGSSSRNIYELNMNSVSWVSAAGTQAPTQSKDGNFRLSTRFLEHRPVTSPPTNQKKVCTQ